MNADTRSFKGSFNDYVVDPLDEANVFLAHGRKNEASKILTEALELEPYREDLKAALADLLAGSSAPENRKSEFGPFGFETPNTKSAVEEAPSDGKQSSSIRNIMNFVILLTSGFIFIPLLLAPICTPPYLVTILKDDRGYCLYEIRGGAPTQLKSNGLSICTDTADLAQTTADEMNRYRKNSFDLCRVSRQNSLYRPYDYAVCFWASIFSNMTF